jgi:phosphoglycolate phosphatase-like HAD superfamily hydrolase
MTWAEVTAAGCDAVFLDFDGVLADSADIKTRAFRILYEEYGAEVAAAAVAHHQAHAGVSRRKKIRYCHKALLGIRLSEADLETLAQRFSLLVEEAVIAADWVPGARRFLDAAHGRLPLFVVSGTPHGELDRITRRRGMQHYFTAIRGSPPSKVPIIRELLRDHGLSADRVLFVGDSTTDYDAATAEGLCFVGRVPAGGDDPFPPGTRVVTDLTRLSP